MRVNSRWWNLVIIFCTLTYVGIWMNSVFGNLLPQFSGFWLKTAIFIGGWYIAAIIAGILYEAETYAWDSWSSMWRPWLAPLHIIVGPIDNFLEGHAPSFCLSPWMIFYPLTNGWQLPAMIIPGTIRWVYSPKYRKEFREEERRRLQENS